MRTIKFFIVFFVGIINAQVGINTDSPDLSSALDVNGKIILRDVSVSNGISSNNLSIDENGLIGISSSKLFVIQTTIEDKFVGSSSDYFNSGNFFPLDWDFDADVLHNDNVIEDYYYDVDGFVVKNSGVYELKSFFNFAPETNIIDGLITFKDHIDLDFIIQYLPEGLDSLLNSNWITISSHRESWQGIAVHKGTYPKTVNSSLYYELKAGDMLRVGIQKSDINAGTPLLSLNFVFLNDFNYSKGLTIKKIN